MPHPIVAATATATSLAILGVVVSDISKTNFWYDHYHTYFIYDSQYTHIIDKILMSMDKDFSLVGPKKVVSGTQKIPGAGYHYFYSIHSSKRSFFAVSEIPNKMLYIGMAKVYPEDDSEYYIIWVPPTIEGEFTFKKFENFILKPGENEIRTVSIDSSGENPRLEWLTKICRIPFRRQQKAMNFIIEKYTEENNFNVRVFIHGKRGVGKSYTSMLLKKELDRLRPNTNSRLYDDFDPSTVGANIQTLALKYASSISPVIVVVDEIDSSYEDVFKEKEDFDPRLKHTRNKNTFHKMLDNFGNFKNVITIYTSEYSPEKLVEINPKYKSNMRPGRLSIVLKMTDDDCFLEEDYWQKIEDM